MSLLNGTGRKTSLLIIGIGNPFRCDDRAGLEAARKIKIQSDDRLQVIEFTSNPVGLLELWDGNDDVILIDATFSQKKPGTFQVIDAVNTEIPAGLFNTSSHNFGVAEAIEMARSLGRLPRKLLIYAIEGKTFKHGDSLSPQVNQAIDEVARKILTVSQ